MGRVTGTNGRRLRWQIRRQRQPTRLHPRLRRSKTRRNARRQPSAPSSGGSPRSLKLPPAFLPQWNSNPLRPARFPEISSWPQRGRISFPRVSGRSPTPPPKPEPRPNGCFPARVRWRPRHPDCAVSSAASWRMYAMPDGLLTVLGQPEDDSVAVSSENTAGTGVFGITVPLN